MANSISTLMAQEHKTINKLLDDVNKTVQDYEKTKASFSKFRWNLEKHIFVEEKAIFVLLQSTSGVQTEDIFKLLQDHSKIMSLLKKIQQGLQEKIKPDLNIIKEELSFHEKFEDELFYPRLDEELTLTQKKEIISRINEVIPG